MWAFYLLKVVLNVMLEDQIKIVSTHTSSTGISGIFELNNKKYFFKKLDSKNFKKELNGYKIIKNYYPVSQLLAQDEQKGILVFANEETIKANSGLLIDCLSKVKTLPNEFTNICQIYRKAFSKTLTLTKPTNCQIFFEDRLPRIKKYRALFKSFDKTNIVFNDIDLTLTPSEKIIKIIKYFNKNSLKWSVIAQADPSDTNLGTKPIIFDYTGGGYVPLMAEFASFYWYYLLQGNYLCPKYHGDSFKGHEKSLKPLGKVFYKSGSLKHTPSPLRSQVINHYIVEVILPTFKIIPNYENWYEDFKNHLAMRMLAIWRLHNFETHDQLLVLAYFEYFYDHFKPKNLKDLMFI